MEGLDSSCALLRELDKVFWRVDPGWVLPLLSAVSAFFFFLTQFQRLQKIIGR